MLNEKKIAQLAVCLSIIILVFPMIFIVVSNEASNPILQILNGIGDFLINVALPFVIVPFLLSLLPYLCLRGAAVSGAALSSAIMFWVYYLLFESSNDPKSGFEIFIFYLTAAICVIVVSMIFAIFRPKWIIKTAKRAFWFACIITALIYGFFLPELW